MLSAYAQIIQVRVMEHNTITLGDMIRIIGHDSTLVIIVLLSALNVILSPLPINSFVLGIPMIVFSLFYLLNWDLRTKHLSFFEKQFDCVPWRKHTTKFIPYLEKFEKLSSPRWRRAMILENRIVSGLCLLLLALIVFLPIPFANIPGSIGMILVALGILQKDGLFVLLGYSVFLLHLIAVLLISYSFSTL